MKRLVFKRWVQILVMIPLVIAFGLLLIVDYESFNSNLTMVLFMLVCLAVIIVNGLLICIYGRSRW